MKDNERLLFGFEKGFMRGGAASSRRAAGRKLPGGVRASSECSSLVSRCEDKQQRAERDGALVETGPERLSER